MSIVKAFVITGRAAAVAIVALTLALALMACGGPAPASQVPTGLAPASVGGTAAAPAAQQPEAAPSGGPTEGIKVHGVWTIDVQEPDGTPVTHTEFENALQPAGANLLMYILAGQATVGRLGIRVVGDGGNNLCRDDSESAAVCYMVESGSNLSGNNLFKNLAISVADFGPDASRVVLRGEFTSAVDGRVGNVATLLWTCAKENAPSARCESSMINAATFTETATGGQVAVEAGQHVVVTVKISFS